MNSKIQSRCIWMKYSHLIHPFFYSILSLSIAVKESLYKGFFLIMWTQKTAAGHVLIHTRPAAFLLLSTFLGQFQFSCI